MTHKTKALNKMKGGCTNCGKPVLKGGKCEDCYVPKDSRGPMKGAKIHFDKQN